MKTYQYVFFGVTIGLMIAMIMTLIEFKIHPIQLQIGGLVVISALIYDSGGKGYQKNK